MTTVAGRSALPMNHAPFGSTTKNRVRRTAYSLLAAGILPLAPLASAGSTIPPVAIHVDAVHRIQTIRPLRTFGTSVDSDPKGKIPLLFSPSRVDLMLSTGLGVLTYRLYTE